MTEQTAAANVPTWTQADRLRKARETAGLAQQELATMTGISRRSISTYEMGDAKPKRPTLLSWALATGVSLDWLTSGAQSVTPRPTGGVRARQDSNLQPSDP